MVAYNDDHHHVDLSLRQADILVALAKDEELCQQGGCVPALQDSSRYVVKPYQLELVHISILGELIGTEDHGRRGDYLPTFHPEFGRFMLEATPGKPWGIGFKDLLDVERNMRWRYALGRFIVSHAEDFFAEQLFGRRPGF